MKYPIGIQSFDQIIEGNYLYVDKTDLLYKLVNEGKIYFLSRPRRFGKSLLLSTLKCYFKGRKELFKGLAIDKLETEWKEYPVFHLDFNGENFTQGDVLQKKIESSIASWEDIYGKDDRYTTIGERFAQVLKRAHKQYGRRAVVLIDEYDKPLLDVLDTGYTTMIDGQTRLLEDAHREILKGFYSIFKAADEDLQFVMLTGVTKFSQVSVFSGFNQPADISMDARYDALCGITEEELQRYFESPLRDLAKNYQQDEATIKLMLKEQYDGYHFSGQLLDIYNPFSILNAFSTMRIGSYWFRTGSPTYLLRLLAHHQENINELVGKFYPEQMFVDYKANVELPLPMLYQSGYLTIKEYNMRRNVFKLDFPNNEVREGFITALSSNYFNSPVKVNNWTQNTVDALEHGNLEQFRKLLTSFLADIPYSMRRKETERERERYFHYTFYLLMRMVSCYTVYTEKQQSEGQVDCIIETPDYIYIFEFKLDGTAEEALQQIEEKGYAAPYLSEKRKLYKVGVSYSSETGTVSDWEVTE